MCVYVLIKNLLFINERVQGGKIRHPPNLQKPNEVTYIILSKKLEILA